MSAEINTMPMIRLLTFLSSLLAWSIGSAAPPVVVIDEAHMQLGKETEAPPLSIPAANSLVVEFSGYVSSLWPDLGEPAPDTIGIAISEDRKYYFALSVGQTRKEFNGSTARPLAGSKPWSGMRAGERAMLMIGKLRVDPISSEEVLRVHWLGLVDAQ